jgi:hypothetical protein
VGLPKSTIRGATLPLPLPLDYSAIGRSRLDPRMLDTAEKIIAPSNRAAKLLS